MRLTVQRPDLRSALESVALLNSTWPDAAEEVMTMVHILRIARPSLADALDTGLISLDQAMPKTGRVRLGHRSARLTARALRVSDQSEVDAPHEQPGEVTWLEVEEIEQSEVKP